MLSRRQGGGGGRDLRRRRRSRLQRPPERGGAGEPAHHRSQGIRSEMSARSNKISRRPFMAERLARRGGSLIVTGLGSPAWDCFAAGDSDEILYSWGGMGLAVPTALGVALSQPGRRVVCATGDGELLMGIGSLGVAADQAPANPA